LAVSSGDSGGGKRERSRDARGSRGPSASPQSSAPSPAGRLDALMGETARINAADMLVAALPHLGIIIDNFASIRLS
jgi:hypothetical protein